MSVSAEAIVTTTGGKIEGSFNKGLYKFSGVSYAAPPIGNRRWLPPEPVESWGGVKLTQRFANISPQNLTDNPFMSQRQPQPMGEDCLYLNIWTPGLDDARRPVMVWIHGGGFATDSGSSLAYNGRTLSTRGNAVIVTINYRLGLLGFLNMNEITRGRIPATGNEGLLDQIMALTWVRDNIKTFGGDPDNVTIFGESAGGMSVCTLMAMPKARGLFHKVIPQSGAAYTATSIEKAAKVAQVFLDVVYINAGDIDRLRSITVEQLLNAYKELSAKALDPKSGIGELPCQPVIDGKVLPQLPINAIANGAADNIPILIGTTLEEMKLMAASDQSIYKLDEAGLLNRLQRLIPTGNALGLIEAYRKARDKRGQSTTPAELFMAIQTDKSFRMPAIRLAESHSRRHQPVYVYLFTWTSPMVGGIQAAYHGSELGFVFGTNDPNSSGTGPETDGLAISLI
jgi:para-nitrobenzyl esterase